MINLRHRVNLLGRRISQILWTHYSLKQPIGRRVPVLCYQRVLPSFEGASARFSLVDPRQFEDQMVFLADNGFRSLSLDEYREIAQARQIAGKGSVLVTFDDGYADHLKVAWPIANRYGIKINLFILTAIVGETGPVLMCEETPAVRLHIQKFPELWRPLSWQELRVMRDSGVGIGLHGHSHRNMASPKISAIRIINHSWSTRFENNHRLEELQLNLTLLRTYQSLRLC